MNVSRPVIAFALLRQSGEMLQTDLLGGVAVLIRPLVSDLAGQTYDATVLANRVAKAYGISLPASALEGFMQRFVAAQVLRIEKVTATNSRAVYCEQEITSYVGADEEKEFQRLLDDYLQYAKPLLSRVKVIISNEDLISGFLTHLSTFDFSAALARPLIADSVDDKATIQGPGAKEKKALSESLSSSATIDVMVAGYVSHLRYNNPYLLAMLARVADGALGVELVLDLQAPTSVPRLSNTIVVVDSPIMLSYLDLSSKQDHEAAIVLLDQIVAAGAKLAVFRHSIDEGEGVLKAIQSARGRNEAYGPTVARLSNSQYRAYFESMINRIGASLQGKFELIQEASSPFYKNFSVGDEEELTADIHFSLVDRRLTRERDAKSVAETMRRQGGAHVPLNQVWSSRYLFVTGNRALQERVAKFLWRKQFVAKDEFVPVVTDRYMSGICWLISGGKSEQSPTVARLLANCAQALRIRPELADRTKKFIAGLDEAKARHFEALMTNDRASQYLVEVTAGNPNVFTSLDMDVVIDEMERRSAEKVAKEKDDYYLPQIENMELRFSVEQRARNKTELQLEGLTVENSIKSEETTYLGEQLRRLEAISEKQADDINTQLAASKENALIIVALSTAVKAGAEEASRIKKGIIQAASRYADRMAFLSKISGAILFFAIAGGLGYIDKFVIPQLPPLWQDWGNIGFIISQALVGLLGLGVISDKFLGKPLQHWRNQWFLNRLKEAGVEVLDGEGATPS